MQMSLTTVLGQRKSVDFGNQTRHSVNMDTNRHQNTKARSDLPPSAPRAKQMSTGGSGKPPRMVLKTGPEAPKPAQPDVRQTRNNKRRHQQRAKRNSNAVAAAVSDLVAQNDGLKDAIQDLKAAHVEEAPTPEPDPIANAAQPKFVCGPARPTYSALPCGCVNGVRTASCSASHVAVPTLEFSQDPEFDVYVSTVVEKTCETKVVEDQAKSPKPDAVISLRATKWWNPFYKRTYTTGKLINRDHEGMSTKRVNDEKLNRDLYTYLLSNRQEVYVNRDQCLLHLQALRRKYYDLLKLSPGNPQEPGYLGDEAVRVDLLTVARVADQKDSEFLLQKTDIYKKRGFSRALSTLFSRRYTTY